MTSKEAFEKLLKYAGTITEEYQMLIARLFADILSKILKTI